MYWMNDVNMCQGSNCGHASGPQTAGMIMNGITYEDERSQDVQPERCQQRDDDVAEDGIREERVGRQRSVSLDDVINAFECQEERSDLSVSETRVVSQNSSGDGEETKTPTVMYTVISANPRKAVVKNHFAP